VKYMSGNLTFNFYSTNSKKKKYLEKLFLKPCRLFCIIFFPSHDWMNGWILVCENQSDLSLDMCGLFFQIMTFFNYRNERKKIVVYINRRIKCIAIANYGFSTLFFTFK
jgi:hypothetical protein